MSRTEIVEHFITEDVFIQIVNVSVKYVRDKNDLYFNMFTELRQLLEILIWQDIILYPKLKCIEVSMKIMDFQL